MNANFGEKSYNKGLSRSQILKRRQQFKRKLIIKRTAVCISILLIFTALIIASVLFFYIAINNGDEFYQEDNTNMVKEVPVNTFSINDEGDFSTWNENCDFNLVVVNKNNGLPDNFKEDLVDFRGVKIDRRIEENLSKMMDDAEKDSISLWISSAYRDVKLQAEIMDDEIYKNMQEGHTKEESEELAKKLISEPGKSEHHTGLAIDFNGVSDDFCNTDVYKWLIENAQNYGFILRYPESKKEITGINFEPWHFRYVGVYTAKAMHGKDICLEEYVDSIK